MYVRASVRACVCVLVRVRVCACYNILKSNNLNDKINFTPEEHIIWLTVKMLYTISYGRKI